MTSALRSAWALPLVCALACLAGCYDNQQPIAADELWQRIHEQGYRDFAHAPGYDSGPKPTSPAHGDLADIYINDVVVKALDDDGPLTGWPSGSLIVKDVFDDEGPLTFVVVMDKQSDGWFFAEYDPDGDALFSGQPDTCLGCHKPANDRVLAFSLP